MSEIKSFDINEIIILLVQEQKFMYDKSSYNYKNKTKKTEVWKEIAKEIKSLTGTNVTGMCNLTINYLKLQLNVTN